MCDCLSEQQCISDSTNVFVSINHVEYVEYQLCA